MDRHGSFYFGTTLMIIFCDENIFFSEPDDCLTADLTLKEYHWHAQSNNGNNSGKFILEKGLIESIGHRAIRWGPATLIIKMKFDRRPSSKKWQPDQEKEGYYAYSLRN